MFDLLQVLGIPPAATQDEILIAYRKKKRHNKFKQEELARVEAAHTQLMMSALTQRAQGKMVDKEVRYADREPLFPWRPKRWDATPKVRGRLALVEVNVLQAETASCRLCCLAVESAEG